MKILALSQSVIGAMLLVAPPALSQTQDSSDSRVGLALESNPPEKLNRIGLSYRMGLNITVDFRKLGGFPPLSDPGPATGSTYNRSYDNGSYNKVDISTNAGGMTWNWGYDSANQIQGNSLIMQSSSSPANAVSNNRENDPQHGLEFSYSRQLYRHKNMRFGLEAALGYALVDASDSHTLHATVNRITDSFAIPGGVNVVPEAPYHGTFEGPGALLSSSPDRTTTIISRDAVVSGERKIDSDVFTLRLGPYAEIPVYKGLSFILSGGLSLVLADTKFSYSETVLLTDTGEVSGPRSGSGSQTDFLVGGYVAGNLSYAVTRDISLFGGVQFQTAGRSVTDTGIRNKQSVTQKESILDLGQAVLLVFGVSYSF